jgi:hypothetical protein
MQHFASTVQPILVWSVDYFMLLYCQALDCGHADTVSSTGIPLLHFFKEHENNYYFGCLTIHSLRRLFSLE